MFTAIGDRICGTVTTQLLRGLGPDSAVVAECLEILGEMLKRFGGAMEREHHQLMTRFLAQVRTPATAVLCRVWHPRNY